MRRPARQADPQRCCSAADEGSPGGWLYRLLHRLQWLSFVYALQAEENLPCAFPERRISCMSAYCIDVAKLAQRCGLPFGWIPNKLFLFGMIAFHEGE